MHGTKCDVNGAVLIDVHGSTAVAVDILLRDAIAVKIHGRLGWNAHVNGVQINGKVNDGVGCPRIPIVFRNQHHRIGQAVEQGDGDLGPPRVNGVLIAQQFDEFIARNPGHAERSPRQAVIIRTVVQQRSLHSLIRCTARKVRRQAQADDMYVLADLSSNAHARPQVAHRRPIFKRKSIRNHLIFPNPASRHARGHVNAQGNRARMTSHDVASIAQPVERSPPGFGAFDPSFGRRLPSRPIVVVVPGSAVVEWACLKALHPRHTHRAVRSHHELGHGRIGLQIIGR